MSILSFGNNNKSKKINIDTDTNNAVFCQILIDTVIPTEIVSVNIVTALFFNITGLVLFDIAL